MPVSISLYLYYIYTHILKTKANLKEKRDSKKKERVETMVDIMRKSDHFNKFNIAL